MARRKKIKRAVRRAFSVKLIPWAYVLGVLGYLTTGMTMSFSRDNLTIPLDNFKRNWWLLPLGFAIWLAGRIFGRTSPRMGVPGAISVKAI